MVQNGAWGLPALAKKAGSYSWGVPEAEERMNARRHGSGEELFSLFEHPICRVSQIMRRNEIPGGRNLFEHAWGGRQPVLAFQFGGPSGDDILMLSAPENEIEWRTADSRFDWGSEVLEFARCADREPELEPEPILGLFDLDVALSPVPEWYELRITKATLVWRDDKAQERPLLGFCLRDSDKAIRYAAW